MNLIQKLLDTDKVPVSNCAHRPLCSPGNLFNPKQGKARSVHGGEHVVSRRSPTGCSVCRCNPGLFAAVPPLVWKFTGRQFDKITAKHDGGNRPLVSFVCLPLVMQLRRPAKGADRFQHNSNCSIEAFQFLHCFFYAIVFEDLQFLP